MQVSGIGYRSTPASGNTSSGEGGTVADDDVIHQIDALVEEEHRLFQHSSSGRPMNEDDERRLKELEVRLDQGWDLLRQRRARRDAGRDPHDGAVRDPAVVEGAPQ